MSRKPSFVIITLPFLALATVAQGVGPAQGKVQARVVQNQPALGKYLAEHPWDLAKKGPMIVAAPPTIFINNQEENAAEYEELKVGSVSVIAPTEMVEIDTEFKEQPNLYEGLPREDKVKYLASLLDNDQWSIATSRGIGLGDLRGEQIAVYRSILPSQFTYENRVMGKNGSQDYQADQPREVTLTADEEAGVRLRFFKFLELGVRFTDGGFSAISTQLEDEYKEGTRYYTRRKVENEEKNSLFGVQIRKVVPNRLKPSDLNYSAHNLDARVDLTSVRSIGDLCKAINSASGIGIIPDVRLEGWTLKTFGQSARAGDLLQALALNVTGTYRKVGVLYDLTWDLEGIGSKILKISLWHSNLTIQTRNRAGAWSRRIAEVGGIGKVKDLPGTPLLPNDAMTSFMATDTAQGEKTMPSDRLPTFWQNVLAHGDGHFGSTNRLRKDVAEPWFDVMWQFVLPTGQLLQWEAELGGANEFRPGKPTNGHASKSVMRPIAIPESFAAALKYQTDKPEQGAQLVDLAKSHGFRELWLQTWNADCLNAAVKAGVARGVPVRLIIEPWEARPSEPASEIDRTILGTTSKESAQIQYETEEWKDEERSWGIGPFPAQNVIPPDSPLRAQHWSKLLALAHTEGIAGVVVLETEPAGYEPTSSNMRIMSIDQSLINALGFTPRQRAKFLAENGVDPVDFIDTRLDVGSLDLLTRPFGEPHIGYGSIESSQPRGAYVKWVKMLSTANVEATDQFAKGLTGLVYFQMRNNDQDVINMGGFRCLPWTPSSILPTGVEQPFVPAPPEKDQYWLWQFGFPLDQTIASRMYDNLINHLQARNVKIAIDLTAIPPDQLVKTLDTWFKAP